MRASTWIDGGILYSTQALKVLPSFTADIAKTALKSLSKPLSGEKARGVKAEAQRYRSTHAREVRSQFARDFPKQPLDQLPSLFDGSERTRTHLRSMDQRLLARIVDVLAWSEELEDSPGHGVELDRMRALIGVATNVIQDWVSDGRMEWPCPACNRTANVLIRHRAVRRDGRYPMVACESCGHCDSLVRPAFDPDDRDMTYMGSRLTCTCARCVRDRKETAAQAATAIKKAFDLDLHAVRLASASTDWVTSAARGVMADPPGRYVFPGTRAWVKNQAHVRLSQDVRTKNESGRVLAALQETADEIFSGHFSPGLRLSCLCQLGLQDKWLTLLAVKTPDWTAKGRQMAKATMVIPGRSSSPEEIEVLVSETSMLLALGKPEGFKELTKLLKLTYDQRVSLECEIGVK